MRKMIIPFFYAIVLHILIVLIIMKLNPVQDFAIQSMVLEMQAIPPEPLVKQRLNHTEQQQYPGKISPPTESGTVEPTNDIDQKPKIDQQREQIQQLARKQHFLQIPVKEKATLYEIHIDDSLVQVKKRKRLSNFTSPDGYRQVPLSPALLQGLKTLFSKKQQPQFDFIPTDAQLQGLAAIFKTGGSTPVEIYPTIKTENTVTAEMFDKELELLVDKGFLYRKKISPQNLLIITTPVGGVPVEMSKKNRLNPVYFYKPAVDKNQLRAYLESQMFILNENTKTSPDSTFFIEKINIIKKYLNLMPGNEID